jgi:membrane protein YdbS with pleckstrin-like domain
MRRRAPAARRAVAVWEALVPNDVKAALSVVVLIVAIAFAYWEWAYGKPHLFWFVIGFAIFAVIAMWVFPEASREKRKLKKGK